ncbi:MAG: hypothetical protein QOI10_2335 [Solirubrobacterales bacterium]|jgi:photosystem II stability/assembly factor-like uncharacterized protein|nr:hypothetical protein [Solirubrobacterales bacterium]
MLGALVSGRALRRGGIAIVLGAGALAVGAAGATAAPVSSGHSGWFWSNPQPQGNTLSGLDFAGTRGYAAGTFGTLLRTDDAGATWSGVNTGLTDPLVRVQVIDPNTVVVGGACALRRSNDGGASFSRLPWTASDEDCPSAIASFNFASGSVGYLLTRDGSVFRTADGGQTFSRQTSVPGTSSAGGSREPTDIYFTSDTTGVAVTRNGGSGKIFRTTDSGNSWVDVASPATGLNGVTFATANDGFAVGIGKTLLTTGDGGATWNPKPLTGAPFQDYSAVDCASATTCLITVGNGHLVRTTDAGATGAEITPATGKINAAAFSSASRVVAVGDRGTTVVSDDGGVTYSPVGSAVAVADLRLLRATSTQIANVGGANGTLVRTTDAGLSWFTVGVPTTSTVVDASFPNAGVGYAIDNLGGAFKTVNGGNSWQILNTGGSGTPFALLATGPNDVLLAGPTGIRRSTDGGTSFAVVGDPDLQHARLTNIAPAGAGSILAWSRSVLRVSTDGGASWKPIALPKHTGVLDASFVSDRIGFILTKSQLLRTKNGGRTWKDLPAIANGGGYGISFASATEGYLTSRDFGSGNFGAQGVVLHTTDGGASWQPQLLTADAPSDLWDAGSTAFSITATGSFLATTSGGQAGTPSALTLKQVGGPKGRVAKAGKVKLTGTLSPAEGGEKIAVMYRDLGHWRARIETAATNGQFTSSFKVRRNTVAVAQWLGDDTRAGAGTAAVFVQPAK